VVLAISVIGASGSGKTATIEYLISRLSKVGFKVGSIKHVHRAEFSIDTPGKDTWRHMKAGALVTVSVAPKEIAVIKKITASKPGCQHDLDEILSLLAAEGLDIVFLEGLHSLVAGRADIPKIVAAKDLDDLKKMLEGTAPPILAITGLVARGRSGVRLPSGVKVPVVDLSRDGDLLFGLVKDYISGVHVSPGSG
jgi:molybdopterin-guanine dinucleotide biosynthesis protein MobB